MNLLDTTYYVTFELSNMCNYAHMHKACPASDEKIPRTIPRTVVEDVLRYLGKNKYSQSISFYVHNEPLVDPRLFNFVEFAHKHCEKAQIIIGTNGWNLTTVLAKELYAVGVSYILASAYSKRESKRLKQVRRELKKKDFRHTNIFPPAFGVRVITKFDSRKDMNCQKEHKRACYCPLTEIVITSSSQIGLCCTDIGRANDFGSLTKESFQTVFERCHKDMVRIRRDLMKGERNLAICKRCIYNGRWKNAFLQKGDNRWKEHIL